MKKVTSDFEALGFNTAISQMMIFVNTVYKKGSCPKEFAEGFIKMISCICPHMGEEIWEIFGHGESIAYAKWPEYSEDLARDDEIEIPVQISGKIKAKIMVGREEEEASVKEKVWNNADVQKATDGKTIVKEIYVKNKIYTIVAK